jgi:hypothetical protein
VSGQGPQRQNSEYMSWTLQDDPAEAGRGPAWAEVAKCARWRSVVLWLMGRRTALYVAAPVSKSLPQGTRPIRLALCRSRHPLSDGDGAPWRRSVPVFARVPSAKCSVALECQVPRANLALQGQVRSKLGTHAPNGALRRGQAKSRTPGTIRSVSRMAALVQGRPPSHCGSLA